MNFRKTIIISVIFHVCLLSAALLFSAGLFKGSGNSLDEKVFFVKLAVDNSKAYSNEFILKKKPSSPEKVVVVKEKKKQPAVVEKTPETVKPDVALEKAPEPIKEKNIENDEQPQADLDKAKVDETVPDEKPKTFEYQKEMIQASLAGHVSESKGLRNGSTKSGLSPAIIDFIGNAIERAKTYPILARKRGMEGTAYLSFKINEKGIPEEIMVQKSSGYSILDSASVKVVRKAAPFPHIKQRIEVPITYRIRSGQKGI